MNTTFWNNLVLGRKYEEEVAQFFEFLGFNVWRIGDWKLPIDLFVWKNGLEFGIEVKFRSNGQPANIGKNTLKKFIGNSGTPVYIITICPDKTWTQEFKERPDFVERELKSLREGLEGAISERGIEGTKGMIDYLERERHTPIPRFLGEYRKIDWDIKP